MSRIDRQAPWQDFYGVVSLLAVLEFAAKDFLEVSQRIGLVLGEMKKPSQTDPNVLGNSLSSLLKQCTNLGLKVTQGQIEAFILEMGRQSPGTIKLSKDASGDIVGVEVSSHGLDSERIGFHLETIYTTLRAEIGSHTFKAISPEKDWRCNPKWLEDSLISKKFEEAWKEFQSAGRCYAYGENTACIFHLMRITDFCLRKVADSLGISYDSHNWHGIGDKITKEMEKKYQTKTDEWKQKEPFYAEILTDINAIGRGHRNPALHELEKQYDEREANYMLTVIEGFATHVATRL